MRRPNGRSGQTDNDHDGDDDGEAEGGMSTDVNCVVHHKPADVNPNTSS